MRKITDFIVKGRYFFLALFIILASVSLYLSMKVNINDDIMKYLPATSETKIGKDIMDKEFAEEDTSVLNVMFKGLSEEEKKETLKKLEAIDGVSSVDYKNTEEYNQGNYTLYVLNVDDYDHSTTATNVYNYVDNNFKTAGMSGSIYEENQPILQLWIVILAIAFAMVILTVLSESYVEPWLYLFSIGIAIFINKGTNLIFDSVSAITNSITAILQLALSMDYSIMLSNRYKQEKETHKNKLEAMKEALYQSFKAISSSSVTTIAGLIALVFMSFTIGKDLGFVLAKGVLLSLVSIFFCLPALLLIFDHLIQKTKKKTPKFNLTKLGKWIYKTRYVQSIFIVLLFVATYLMKGNIGILFTASEQDKVGKIFPATNQMAIVYNNQYEELITNYCKELEKDEKIDQVLCYSNTINEKLAYDELNQKFKELGQETEIENNLIKLIYYNYYNQDENNKMTLEEFISFIQSDIYTNEDFQDSIDQKMRDNLDLLKNFTSSPLRNEPRTTNEIASILGMRETDAKNIFIYYNSKHLNTTLTIKDFVDFMLNDVAKDEEYAKSLDSSTIAKLKQLQNFTDLSKINKEMTAKELAEIFGIQESKIDELFLFYRVNTPSATRLTLGEFATTALEMANQPNYQNMFDENMVNSLKMLLVLTSKETYDAKTMPQILSQLGSVVDEETMLLLYTYYTGSFTEQTLTVNEFATLALSMADDENFNELYEKYIKGNEKQLKMLQLFTTDYDTPLTREALYDKFNISETDRMRLNLFINKDMTPKEFANTLLTNSLISSQLTEQQKIDLNSALYIMSIADQSFSWKQLVTETKLGLEKTTTCFVYGFHEKENLMKITVKDLIKFLYTNKENEYLKPYLEEIKTTLEFSYSIAMVADNPYKDEEMTNILNTITTVDPSQVTMIFGVYDYNHEVTTMTPYHLVNLILNNKDNPLLKGQLTSRELSELSLVKEGMNSTINKTKYTSSNLGSLLGIDKDTMNLLFGFFQSKYLDSNQKVFLKDYVDFIIKEVMNNRDYASNFDDAKREKLTTINTIMQQAEKKTKYTSSETFELLNVLSDGLDPSLLDLVYMYYGSSKEYDDSWKMTIEEFVNYLNKDIITDSRFDNFIDKERKTMITDAQQTVKKSKKQIVSDNYSRAVLNTKYAAEDEETYRFVHSVQDKVGSKEDIYVVGNSPMAVEMSKTFNNELNKITILTMIFIFIVVAVTFKDLIIPFVLVLIIQTAVYITMSGISLTSGSEYFISLLIVQAILMGATIDYAIVYTSYYRESRVTMSVKESVINAYNKSIHTIISSSSILIIVTLIVAHFASAIAAKICETISQGTFASVILILFVLPGVLATTDKFICRKGYYEQKKKTA